MLLFLLGKYLGAEWLDHIIGMYLAEKKSLLSFPEWLFNFKFPVAVYDRHPYILTSLPTLGMISHFSHLNRCVWFYHCSNLYFPYG